MYSRKRGDKLRAKAPWSYAVREESYLGYKPVVVLKEYVEGLRWSEDLGEGLVRIYIDAVKTFQRHDIVWRWSDGRKMDWRPCGFSGCTCRTCSTQVEDLRAYEAAFDMDAELDAIEPVTEPRAVVSKRGIKCDGYLAVARTYAKRVKRVAKAAPKAETWWERSDREARERREEKARATLDAFMTAEGESECEWFGLEPRPEPVPRKVRRQWKLAKKMDFKRDWKLLAVYHTISADEQGALELARSLELSGG